MERYPDIRKEVNGPIPGCEIFSLLDIKLARWVNFLYVLWCWLACRPSISKEKEKKKKSKGMYDDLFLPSFMVAKYIMLDSRI